MLSILHTKRADLHFFSPTEIEVLDPQAVNVYLATLIFDHGQVQPVLCRYVRDEVVQLVSGHGRIAAIALIREGFRGFDGQLRRDPEFAVKAIISEANDEVAGIRRQLDNMLDAKETCEALAL